MGKQTKNTQKAKDIIRESHVQKGFIVLKQALSLYHERRVHITTYLRKVKSNLESHARKILIHFKMEWVNEHLEGQLHILCKVQVNVHVKVIIEYI